MVSSSKIILEKVVIILRCDAMQHVISVVIIDLQNIKEWFVCACDRLSECIELKKIIIIKKKKKSYIARPRDASSCLALNIGVHQPTVYWTLLLLLYCFLANVVHGWAKLNSPAAGITESNGGGRYLLHYTKAMWRTVPCRFAVWHYESSACVFCVTTHFVHSPVCCCGWAWRQYSQDR